MRYDARVDGNQAGIVKDLRKAGARVYLTHRIGGGFPDTVVAYQGHWHLLEIKMPGEKLTPAERKFFDEYTGCAPLAVVHDSEEALAAIGAI